jgi:gluconolactonase
MSRVLASLSLVCLVSVIAGSQESMRVPGIPGVVAEGTRLEVVKTGFGFPTEGPIARPDGTIYFTELRNTRLLHLDPKGEIHVVRENTGGANGLTVDKSGNVLAAESTSKRVTRMDPRGQVTVIAEASGSGQPLSGPNDLIADPHGGIYFTDPGSAPSPTQKTGSVYYIRPDGKVLLVTNEIVRPNGVTLTLDGRRLLVDDTRGGNTVFAFDVREDGSATNKRPFAELRGIPAGESSMADGMAVDGEGRIYVTSITGIQVFTASGEYLGTIPLYQPQSLVFAGPDRRTMYITAPAPESPKTGERIGAIYRLRVLARGSDRPGGR